MLTHTRTDKQLRAHILRWGFSPDEVEAMDRETLEKVAAAGQPAPKLRKVAITERKLDGGEAYANGQIQVPGHDPVRFDEDGVGWIPVKYDGEDISIEHVVREKTIRVTDTVRTRKVDVGVKPNV